MLSMAVRATDSAVCISRSARTAARGFAPAESAASRKPRQRAAEVLHSIAFAVAHGLRLVMLRKQNSDLLPPLSCRIRQRPGHYQVQQQS